MENPAQWSPVEEEARGLPAAGLAAHFDHFAERGEQADLQEAGDVGIVADDFAEILDALGREAVPVEAVLRGSGQGVEVDLHLRAVREREEENEADVGCEVDDRDEVADFEFHGNCFLV